LASERRHDHDAGDREGDPEPTDGGVLAGRQVVTALQPPPD